MKYKRIFLLVLDSLGVGEADDASNYGDVGSNTLKHIDEKAFYYCSNLKNIDIPQEVETIGKEAFSGCHFQSIYVHWLEPIDINTNVFSLIFYGMPPVLYIPKGTMDAYQSAEVWKEYHDRCLSPNRMNQEEERDDEQMMRREKDAMNQPL